MNGKDRNQKEITEKQGGQDRLLGWLYGHTAGRLLLRPLVSPWFSRLGGRVLDSSLSALAVKPFVRACGIDLSGCESQTFSSYNAFFKRKLRPGMRPVCMDPQAVISPCDARLSVWPVTENGRFCIKHTEYTVESLLRSPRLARYYEGGCLWLYRLCVDDYHRYIYPVTGQKSRNVHIQGVYHTVNPVANDVYPIYKENTREYCLIRTGEGQIVTMMEVGAMLVGLIENRTQQEAQVTRGEEKGNFAFGGSTIVILTAKDSARPNPRLTEATKAGLETKVRMGEKVGTTTTEQ